MRYVFVVGDSVIDSKTGESLSPDRLQEVLLEKPGGIIAGTNMYPVLARLITMIKSDHGWSGTLKQQSQKKLNTDRVGGVIYFTKLTYRFPKERQNGKRFRPGSIKWLVLNLELFHETTNVQESAEALVGLASRRGVSPRHSPGAFGGAMLRASPQWEKKRQPAPWFISERARIYLPGNYYALRHGYAFRKLSTAYYLDQKSSHHTIASTVPLPHPMFLRARGRLRAVERGDRPPWVEASVIPYVLKDHVGLLAAMVECDTIAPTQEHLYPPWARTPGTRLVWIWTPELRLLDRRVRVRWISCALTSFKMDPALHEFAEWSLEQLRMYKHPAIKSALLAAYGLLGIKTDREIQSYSVTGRPKPERADLVKMPLVGDVYRSTVKNVRVSSIQNVVARGVIEAETRTRSIEYARQLESEGIKVSQIYADGLIAVTDQLPLFIPDHWRVAGELTNVSSPHANTIFSDNMIRTPGIPNGRRTVAIT